MIFHDRTDAGRKLAAQLQQYGKGRSDVTVLGIPRGGMPVAFEVATALNAPLDLFIARKLGVPGQEELAFGAIASGGVRVLDPEIVEAVGISERRIEEITGRERSELERREQAYRGDRPPVEVYGRTAILVDDGIATGSSMRAAIFALRALRPERIIVAVPVAPPSTCKRLRLEVDELVCVATPEFFDAIGRFYEDFSQVSDQEVRNLLQRAPRPTTSKSG
jgi:putative phosphoribosyl transferase